jgi:hypothetical protein
MSGEEHRTPQEWADHILKTLPPHFYGAVTLKYENGVLVHCVRQESLKPPHAKETGNAEGQ